MTWKRWGWIWCAALAAAPAAAEEVLVAVASNFSAPAREIARRYEAETGHTAVLSFGSTGRHYAQILNGAPFQIFLAADIERPRLLEQEGRTVPGSRFTYAEGRIALWSAREGYVDPEGRILSDGAFRHLALANPRVAPYGRAAQSVLESLDLWTSLQERLVLGENIGQAHQFVMSGNADLGFVAVSQLQAPGRPMGGSAWIVPQDLYGPISQQAVLLKDSDAARAFLAFLRSDASRSIIGGYGYGFPPGRQVEDDE